jgi:LPXTG-site transpeptidase (sortase) family protein
VTLLDPQVVEGGPDSSESGPASGDRLRRIFRARNIVAALAALPVLLIGGWPGGDNDPAAPATPKTKFVASTQADPVRVLMPRLKINAGMQALHLDAKSSELLPPDYGIAGWYQAGPEPGEAGRAVIAGHLNSVKGPDVFWSLKDAKKGDEIIVETKDGTKLTFKVNLVELHRRDAFPTSRVYGGDRKNAELRLITCGGEYVKSKGGYQSNVVVFADPVSSEPPAKKAAKTETSAKKASTKA